MYISSFENTTYKDHYITFLGNFENFGKYCLKMCMFCNINFVDKIKN